MDLPKPKDLRKQNRKHRPTITQYDRKPVHVIPSTTPKYALKRSGGGKFNVGRVGEERLVYENVQEGLLDKDLLTHDVNILGTMNKQSNVTVAEELNRPIDEQLLGEEEWEEGEENDEWEEGEEGEEWEEEE